jgi:hypothetical protein|nr:MAG TPA: hypothetical protein [Caudoviricetes sp.]
MEGICSKITVKSAFPLTAARDSELLKTYVKNHQKLQYKKAKNRRIAI